MSISMQMLLIAMVYASAQSTRALLFPINNAYNTPLCLGFLVGVITGRPLEGAILGAQIGMLYLGMIAVGGTIPANQQIAGTVGVSFALLGGLEFEMALAIATAAGIAFSSFSTMVNTISIFFANWSMALVKQCKIKQAWRVGFLAPLSVFLIHTVFMFSVISIGTAAAEAISGAIPDWLNTGMAAAAGTLPAIGLALGLRQIGGRGKIWVYVIAFVLASQLGLSTVSIILLATSLVILQISNEMATGQLDTSAFLDSDNGEKRERILTLRDYMGFSLTALHTENWFRNYATQNGPGWVMASIKPLRKLYPNDEQKVCEEALKHNTYTNTTTQAFGAIMSPLLAMEEERAAGNESVTIESIQNFKAGTMGPVASIGDPLCQGVFNLLFKTIGISLVINSNSLLGPWVNFLGVAAVNYGVNILFTWLGYKYGSDLVSRFFRGGVINSILDKAGIVGCAAFGALAVSTVKLSLGIEFMGINLQTDFFDRIMTGILPMILIIVCWSLLRKNKIKMMSLMMLLFFGALILGCLGILA